MDIQAKLGEWWDPLSHIFSHPVMNSLGQKLAHQYDRITPEPENIFNAFTLCPYSKTKVVILGQDPYPTPGVAHGLSFSVAKPPIPPSLKIIFKELERTGWNRTNPNLTDWAQQGVLLLNTVLTTLKGTAFAHRDLGWHVFTEEVLRIINNVDRTVVFLVWGAPAKEVIAKVIDHRKHKVFYACHPMAQQYSGGKTMFVGCDHFTKANQFLKEPINWGDSQ